MSIEVDKRNDIAKTFQKTNGNLLSPSSTPLPGRCMIRLRQTKKLFEIIKDIHNSNLISTALLLIVGVVNMFIINNRDERTKRNEKKRKDPPAYCVFEAHELCLSCNNTVFNNTNYL